MERAARVERSITTSGLSAGVSDESRLGSYCLLPRSSLFIQASGLLLKVMPKAEVNNEETLVVTFHFGTRSSRRFLRRRWWSNDVSAANR